MNAADALDLIQALASLGDVSFTQHALDEAENDGLVPAALVEGLKTALGCSAQANDRWLVRCEELDGEEFSVVALIRGDLLVITVFR